MKRLLTGEKRRMMLAIAAIVFGGILFYVLLEHFPAVRTVVSRVMRVLAPIVYGLCAAFVINLPMSFFENKVFRRLNEKRPAAARWLSLVISYALVLGFAALIIALVVPRVTEGVLLFSANFGGYVNAASQKLEELAQKLASSPEVYAVVEKAVANAIEKLNAFAVDFLPKLPGITVSALGVLYSVLVTFVISIHALMRKERLVAFAKRIATATVPEKHLSGFFEYCSFANSTFRKYIVGQLLSCVLIGVLCYIGMRVLSMPYPELISAFICVAALIPIIGPWVSIGLSAFIILMTSPSDPWLALWFIIMMVVIQLLDDNIVYPRILGGAIGVPGLLVLASIIVAGGLFGIPGLLVAVPTAAVLRRIFNDWVALRNNERAEKAEASAQNDSRPGGEAPGEEAPLEEPTEAETGAAPAGA
ncbi:MAG: AI-2E family transporter [Clostridia bacterium]|nr:AI-2E family transporter [Clostridia bacterium]